MNSSDFKKMRGMVDRKPKEKGKGAAEPPKQGKPQKDPPPNKEPKTLDEMSLEELRGYAKEKNISTKDGPFPFQQMNRDDLLAAIKAAEAAEPPKQE